MSFLLASSAGASSCCTGSGGQSLCVLPAEQGYQVGLASTFRAVNGEFDPYGNLLEAKQNKYQTLTTTLGAAFRLGEDWQIGASLPWKSAPGMGVGDPSLEARYALWEDLSFLWHRPALSFYGGLRAPLGRSLYTTDDPSAASVTGEGAWIPHVGVTAAKLFRPLRFTLDGAYFQPLAHRVEKVRSVSVAEPYSLRPGSRYQLLETVSVLPTDSWSVSLALKQLWQLETSVEGSGVQGTAARLFSTAVAFNYFPTASWGLGAAYETAFPFQRYGANQQNLQNLTVSAVYGGGF